MKKKIIDSIKSDIAVKQRVMDSLVDEIEKLAGAMSGALKKGKKILLFGNGGSAADSIHIAAELIGRFKKERRALPAIALPANISSLTALGNDYGYERIFERQIEALGSEGDVALGISTSGKSENVVRAMEKAKSMNMITAVLMGGRKTVLCKCADIVIGVPSDDTPRIQEAHITIAHILCDLVEDAL